MPKIIVQANVSPSGSGPATLGERVQSDHLTDAHYAAQLIARIRWAAEDAEMLESEARASGQQPATTSARAARPVAVVLANPTADATRVAPSA